MTSKAKVIGGALSVVATVIGTAAAIKALAAPAPVATPPAAIATGGSAAVTGSNNNTVVGSGNNFINGAATGLGAGAGNVINVNTGAVTNVFPRAAKPANESSPGLAKALPGQWQVGFVYPTSLGDNQVEGHTSLLRNGSYAFQGTETARATAQGKRVEIQWGVTDVGKWVARDGFLTMESSGLRSVVKSMVIDGTPVDVARLRALGMPEPRLEDYFPSGMATDFKLVSVSNSEMRLQATSPVGSTFDMVSRRTSAI